MKYLHWDQKTIMDFSETNINEMYEKGYVFTRLGKGVMQQTRSIRIDLSKFSLSSENRRILKKTESISISEGKLPVDEYDYKLGKLAKDFYDTKFGPGIMSAQKVKEMLTDPDKSNFNTLFIYNSSDASISPDLREKTERAMNSGFVICYKNSSLLHYSYPFYDLTNSSKDMGLGMMIRAIDLAKQTGLKYIYLGSLQRSSDTYKLQFEGIEWFDGTVWKTDLDSVKEILKNPAVE